MVFKLVASANQPSLLRLSLRSLFGRPAEGAPVTEQDNAHFAILKMGVAIWNHWRVQEPITRPLLCDADLTGLDLENVNFCNTDLSGANLSGCYLYDADFQGANLRNANLSRAGLIGASFHSADLSQANLSQAYLAHSDLSSANLHKACLQEADLQSALLTKTKFEKASLAKAAMTDCFDLTLSQLQSAQDADLAFCPTSFRVQLDSALGLTANDAARAKLHSAADGIARRTEHHQSDSTAETSAVSLYSISRLGKVIFS